MVPPYLIKAIFCISSTHALLTLLMQCTLCEAVPKNHPEASSNPELEMWVVMCLCWDSHMTPGLCEPSQIIAIVFPGAIQGAGCQL